MTAMVCLGLATLDVVQRVGSRPTWGRKSVAQSTEVVAGGPATNAAITAARLLGQGAVSLVSGVGGSLAGRAVAEELASYGVRLLDLAPPEGGPALGEPVSGADSDGANVNGHDGPQGQASRGPWQVPVATCLVEPDGARTVVSPGALTSDLRLSPAAHSALAEARVLLVDGHHPCAAEEALTAIGPGTVVVLDAGSAKPRAQGWLDRIDVVAGSADYAEGLGLPALDAIEAVLAAGAGAAIITDGPGAVRWREAGSPRVFELVPPQVEALDTLGAGDAFHGALAAGLVRGLPLAAAVDLAVRVASTRVSYVGARAFLAHVYPLT